tara:strand:+ start:83 stop:574 length:492 start_codon:yes stop_codon:yes gene_type:complete
MTPQLLLLLVPVMVACTKPPRFVVPTYQQLQLLLSDSEFAAAYSKYQRYDKDKDKKVDHAEIKRRFEYLPRNDLQQYWKNCDSDVDGTLVFEEWLACSLMYSDNGELYENSEVDSIVNDGLLSYNSYQKLELTELAWQAYNERQPNPLSEEELEKKAKRFREL